MKVCICCKEELPLERFTLSNRFKSGYNGQCKRCVVLRPRTKWLRFRYIPSNKKKSQEVLIDWESPLWVTERGSHMLSLYWLDNPLPKKKVAKVKPEPTPRQPSKLSGSAYVKWKAQKDVELAFRRGAMTRPTTCEECFKECKPHAHHDDYTKPLEVRFLCCVCHSQWHKKHGGGGMPVPVEQVIHI